MDALLALYISCLCKTWLMPCLIKISFACFAESGIRLTIGHSMRVSSNSPTFGHTRGH